LIRWSISSSCFIKLTRKTNMTTDDSVERTDRVEQSLNISEDEMKEIYNNGKPIPYDDSVKKLVAEFKTSMQCGTDERTGKRQYLVEDEEWEEIISTLTTFKDQCVREERERLVALNKRIGVSILEEEDEIGRLVI
jgi:uncharacterized protein (UPF0335 family)